MYYLCRLSKRSGRERGKGMFKTLFPSPLWVRVGDDITRVTREFWRFCKIIKRKSRILKDRESQQYTASVCYRSKSCCPFKLWMVSLWQNMAVLDRSKDGWVLGFSCRNPAKSHSFPMALKIPGFFGIFRNTVRRNATKSHSTPSPVEPVVLMYFLLGFSQSCGPWKPSKFEWNTEE